MHTILVVGTVGPVYRAVVRAAFPAVGPCPHGIPSGSRSLPDYLSIHKTHRGVVVQSDHGTCSTIHLTLQEAALDSPVWAGDPPSAAVTVEWVR